MNGTTLKPNRKKHAFLLVVCLGFSIAGVCMIIDGEPFGWLVTALFGLGVPTLLVNLLPGSAYLKLDPEGMETRTLYRRHFTRWSDVEEFFTRSVRGHRMVCWKYAPGYRAQAGARRFAERIAGAEAALPDTYGRSAEQLAGLLDEWRIRHGGTHGRTARSGP